MTTNSNSLAHGITRGTSDTFLSSNDCITRNRKHQQNKRISSAYHQVTQMMNTHQIQGEEWKRLASYMQQIHIYKKISRQMGTESTLKTQPVNLNYNVQSGDIYKMR